MTGTAHHRVLTFPPRQVPQLFPQLMRGLGQGHQPLGLLLAMAHVPRLHTALTST
jgi:hypothetical protein